MSKNIAKLAAKTATKKSPAKKAAPKKAAAKKSVAKKAAPKKVAAKKTVAKKAAPKKVAAKKPARLTAKAAAIQELCQIKGIGAKFAEKLYASRIKSVAMVAKLNKKDVERLAAKLKIGARMSRENWVGQAKKLAKRK